MSNFSSAQIAATVVASSATSSSKKDVNRPTPLWEQTSEQLDAWVCSTSSLLKVKIPTKDEKIQALLTPSVLTGVWKTLESALSSIYLQEIAEPEQQISQDDMEDGSSPPKPVRKRRKRIKKKLVDPFNLWVHVKRSTDDTNKDGEEADDQDIDVPETAGGQLSVLSVRGLLNGMAGIAGGVTKRVTPSQESISSVKEKPTSEFKLADLLVLAHAWHRAIQLQVHRDILLSTPRRIQDMLCPDLTDTEFASIRKRIYDTVIMGKGLHTNDPSSDVDPTLATGPSAQSHEIEKHKKCHVCDNNDQSTFIVDRKNGDVICSNCGTVVSESLMHEG